MSGIYVLKCKDGFRVAYSESYESMIGRFDDKKIDYELVPLEIKKVFGDKPVFAEYSDALTEASKISALYRETEDGVFVMRQAAHKTFEEVVNGN